MSIKIWNCEDLYSNPTFKSVECLKNEKMQIVFYTLRNKESLNIIPDDYSVTSTIILLDGALKIYSADESYDLKAHDMAMLIDIDQSYYVEAVGVTKLLAVSSEENQDTQEDAVVASMLTEVEQKDIYTHGHSRRVSLYAKRLALTYDSTYNVIALSAAACTHDIGKINIPIEILQKPGKLTVEEFDVIKRHPGDSYSILQDKLGERVAVAAKQHHERLDGSGYPDGLCGDEICMDARIISIADVFDAMTCKRIYNEPSPPLAVVRYLEENSDKYDSVIVGILRTKVERGEMDDILTAFIAE